MTKKMVLDVDFIKYSVASAGEKASILAVEKQSGNEYTFKTRTEMYGRGKKKDAGWLAEYNKGRDSPLLPEDFEITDIYVQEPIQNVLNSAKEMTRRIFRESKCDTMVGFIGKGDSFRVERSTILKYKDRGHLHKPAALEEVSDYLIRRFGFEVVETIEADDAVVIEAYRDPDAIVCAVDKDTLSQPVLSWNPNKPEKGIINGACFGDLYIDDSGSQKKVRGYGRKFLYFQCLVGDSIDNYRANSANPDYKWGDMSGYNLLKDTTCDKEALEALVRGYKTIYPEPVEVLGWRGDKLVVDWRYALDESFELARMLRTMDELDNRITASSVLERYGIT